MSFKADNASYFKKRDWIKVFAYRYSGKVRINIVSLITIFYTLTDLRYRKAATSDQFVGNKFAQRLHWPDG